MNQDAAIDSIRAIKKAEGIFFDSTGQVRYGTLRELATHKLVKQELSDGSDQGYRFDLRVDGITFVATAVPEIYGMGANEGTGAISLFVDETGVIRWNPTSATPATKSSEPMGTQN